MLLGGRSPRGGRTDLALFRALGPRDDFIEQLGRVMPTERVLAAWDGGRAVGGAGAFPFMLTVPGGRVAAAGVTLVGVLPTHRRRGVLTAMMRSPARRLPRARRAGGHLWATEDTIYGRFGYGVASFSGEIELPRERSAYSAAFESRGHARLVPLDEAEGLVAPVYERVAVETPGMFARTCEWWQARALSDPDWRRRGSGELQCVVLESAGGAARPTRSTGSSPAFERGVQTGAIEVVEAMGDSPGATRAIWRYLLDVDWMARVKAWSCPSTIRSCCCSRSRAGCASPSATAYGCGSWIRGGPVGALVPDGDPWWWTSPTGSVPGTPGAGPSAAAAASEPSTSRNCAAMSRRSAPSISAASPGRSSRGRCGWKKCARARSRAPMRSSARDVALVSRNLLRLCAVSEVPCLSLPLSLQGEGRGLRVELSIEQIDTYEADPSPCPLGGDRCPTAETGHQFSPCAPRAGRAMRSWIRRSPERAVIVAPR